ncbi:MAG: YhjD/YihY/BrkB family envelope integrity protein [Phycisphaerales bacterium]|nr:YhjD/YihY/BrkB family envelope integrity protein [Phycisphaerales bacterium]MDG1978867.1 YhjD/YihY/BrkB family envelope integrity protein [Phycisphaerales bacterium]MDG2134075.1 YhjD/YihY/BrkB family envelope integrity protein [Phycisphaerales bacterium]
MIKTLLQTFEWLRLAVTQPMGQLTAMQRQIRRWLEVLRYCGRHLSEDRAPVLAAALSFRTLFGLVPVLVVATVIARSFLKDEFPNFVRNIITELGLAEVSLGGTEGVSGKDLGSWLEGLVANASSVDLSTLGWVGFVVVAFSAIWVLVTIEEGFNRIYRAPHGRTWLKRLMIYWFLLTFPAVLIGGAPLVIDRIDAIRSILPDWAWLATTIEFLAGAFVLWILLFMTYLWVPNTVVKVRPAMVGAFTAAILIEAAKHLLGIYTSQALTLNKLYGSLGLIPLFMFWMYLMWIFVLLGLEVSAIIQVLRGRDIEFLARQDEEEGLVDPAIAIRVVQLVAAGFEDGAATEPDAISRELKLDLRLVRAILDRLERAGILLRLDSMDGYSLAKPADRIDLDEILSIGFDFADEKTIEFGPLFERLRSAQRAAVEGMNLKSLDAETPPVGG